MRLRIILGSICALLLLSILLTAQPDPRPVPFLIDGNDYEKAWAKVDSLENKGLTRQALEVVSAIYKLSLTEKNYPQQIKTLLEKLRLESYIQEDSYITSIAELERELNTLPIPSRQILHSVLGEVYQQYYYNNQYRYNERSTTIAFEPEDVSTWDLQRITQAVIDHLQLSLTAADTLQAIKLEDFDAILNKPDSSGRKLRPTLYDFLAHRALDIFSSGENHITRPANAWRIDRDSLLSDARTFIQIELDHPDTLSYSYQATRVFKELLRFRLNQGSIAPLVDADLRRLKYMYENGVMPLKDTLYLNALVNLKTKFNAHPSSAEVNYHLASWYASHEEGDTLYRNKLIAVRYCEEAIEKFPDSYGAKLCRNLLRSIRHLELTVTLPEAVLPDTRFPMLISYRNTEKIWYRITRLPDGEPWAFDKKHQGAEQAKAYIKLPFLHLKRVDLPGPEDHYLHTTEVISPALPAGTYVLLSSPDSTFNVDQSPVSITRFQSSELAYATINNAQPGPQVSVRDRSSGKAAEGATVTWWTEHYDYNSRKYEFKKAGQARTDKNGIATLSTADNYNHYHVSVTEGKKVIYSDNQIYHYSQERGRKKAQITTRFFTDRSIYRPGQSVHFKGIMTEHTGDSVKILVNRKTTVKFLDVNSQKIDELILTTNEFGSFSGTFSAPQGTLNGQMRIMDDHGTVWISVEEYKRPKFEVIFEPVKGNYKLNQEITVTGKALSYAGAPLGGSKVTYRVMRNASFPFWRWRSYLPHVPETQMITGETTVKEDGTFDIVFNAIPDPSVDPANSPVFSYTVYADVTDLSGETRSASMSASAGYKSLYLDISNADKINLVNPDTFRITARNLNYQPQQVNFTLKLYKLVPPAKTQREKLWEQPDRHLLSEKEYNNLLPLDEYKNESDPANWEKGELVKEISARTSDKGYNWLPSDISNWSPGIYLAELTARDTFGDLIHTEKRFTAFHPNAKVLPAPVPAWVHLLTPLREVGETASVLIGSGWKDARFFIQTEVDNKLQAGQWITVDEELKRFDIPVTKAHKGNFAIHISMVKHNRFYATSYTVVVPHTDKRLDITFETFREKLYPGQEEEWKLKITNAAGDKKLAEMVATLYDASLDAFKPHYFNLNIWNYRYPYQSWSASSFGPVRGYMLNLRPEDPYERADKIYPMLYWQGLGYGRYDYDFASAPMAGAVQTESAVEEQSETRTVKRAEKAQSADAEDAMNNIEVLADKVANMVADDGKDNAPTTEENIRTNLNETAFFFPHLKTDENGNIVFSFTMPEALTRWNFLGLAHSKDLSIGSISKSTVTAKDLMVMPNLPRFVREGDTLIITARVDNITALPLDVNGSLDIMDAFNMQPAKGVKVIPITTRAAVKAKSGGLISWQVIIPTTGYQALAIAVRASGGKHTDGEQQIIPVLSNRKLVTETLPLPVRGNEEKTFTLQSLVNSGKSNTLTHHALTLEFTSNPAWYAVQALPYLMEYPYACTEQTFNRYYANSIATSVANSSPRIRQVFEAWKMAGSEALLSALEKNSELKQIVLEETPWVLQAKSESERKKRIALLFDLNKMASEQASSVNLLLQAQSPNGGFPWFKGMPDNRYITQYIAAGYGHLLKLNMAGKQGERLRSAMESAVRYSDQRILEDLEELKTFKADLSKDHLHPVQAHYLYMRSFYPQVKMNEKQKEAFDYYMGQAEKYWKQKSRFLQGMLSLAAHRQQKTELAKMILASLKENAIYHAELGMYWKEYTTPGYYWYDSPVETQALMIEAFHEVTNDQKAIDELRLWLLKNKQVNDWGNTKATAEACYALLITGADWLQTEPGVIITVGNKTINPTTQPEIKTEAGTGYFKLQWNEQEITPAMGKVTVNKTTSGPGWGALYWQYFENLDKIQKHASPLKVSRKHFVERSSDRGPVIEPVTPGMKLKPGDKIMVRVILETDRTMEYVHMKDMRAAGLEPLNVLSGSKYQDGLWYYESTRDASTDFFFAHLPRGKYVFEYALRVTHEGSFSNGITEVQCMYAPEFAAHSEGLRVRVR